MKKVIVTGAAGRMGQSVIELLSGESIEIFAVDQKPVSGSAMVALEQGALHEAPSADAVIDFSHPRFLREVCRFCSEKNIALVSGTTNIGRNEIRDLEAVSKTAPVIWAANMSFGIAMLKKMMDSLAHMPEADFFIDDIHHKHKLDAPSGTAKVLQQHLQEKLAGSKKVNVNAHRAGGIYGEHTVHAATDEEFISIRHSALNRLVFARGALASAKWLQQKPAGKYTIEDVLGI